MPRKQRTPKYGLHKATGQARVIINGEHIYVGECESEESLTLYKEPIDEWRRQQQARLFPSLTMAQLSLLYMQHATSYYRGQDS